MIVEVIGYLQLVFVTAGQFMEQIYQSFKTKN